jgi:N utilization substance protein A
LADLATDEVRGGYDFKDGERIRVNGALESFNLSVEDAEMLILRARVAAGWISEDDLPRAPEPEYVEEDEEAAEPGEFDGVWAQGQVRAAQDAVAADAEDDEPAAAPGEEEGQGA